MLTKPSEAVVLITITPIASSNLLSLTLALILMIWSSRAKDLSSLFVVGASWA